ncbi:hypothetical protein JVU11DRAFT_3526 [Chiua virens]|nr:hypothetical protein JVU11DRAFT_3526 [Chiua virens]
MSNSRLSDVSQDSSRLPRTIVLCFDGTNGQYDATNSNVVKFFGLLRKDCPDKQVAYYQAGIGTYFAPGVVSSLWTRLASLMDEAVAWYLDAHVMGGYEYLMETYRPGDKICLFGFSRGAYTARALAGMLTKVGLLPKANVEQVDFAYKAYTRTDKEGVKLADGFKKTFCQDVTIEYVGVWDTVQSTGVLVSRSLPFTESNTAIRVFRHALSLDEHRSRFRPNLYHWPVQDAETFEMAKLGMTAPGRFSVFSFLGRLFKKGKSEVKQSLPDETQQRRPPDKAVSDTSNPKATASDEQPTDVLEVWFSGCHSDVGGGNVGDDVEISLAQIPLHWMLEQVIQSGCSIIFDHDELARIGFKFPSDTPQPPVTPEQTVLDSKTNDPAPLPSDPSGPNAYPEQSDAIAPLYDELEINPMWWILEILPASNAWQDSDGTWHSETSFNLGRGRIIPDKNPKFHHTVKERINSKLLNYTPRATYDQDEVYV